MPVGSFVHRKLFPQPGSIPGGGDRQTPCFGADRYSPKYEAMLANYPNLDIVDLDRDVIRQAARLCAKYRIRPPYALQVGASLLYGADVFITNDGLLKRLQDKLEVIILDDFVDGA